MTRDPRTPDCSVRGCTRAAYRLGLCREHARYLPVAFGVECAVECMKAQRRVKLHYHRRARRIAEAGLAAEHEAAAA